MDYYYYYFTHNTHTTNTQQSTGLNDNAKDTSNPRATRAFWQACRFSFNEPLYRNTTTTSSKQGGERVFLGYIQTTSLGTHSSETISRLSSKCPHHSFQLNLIFFFLNKRSRSLSLGEILKIIFKQEKPRLR